MDVLVVYLELEDFGHLHHRDAGHGEASHRRLRRPRPLLACTALHSELGTGEGYNGKERKWMESADRGWRRGRPAG